MKKIGFIFALVLFASWSQAKAGVYISEIMYDFEGTDTDYEWVELGNDGGEDVDITGWKFNDGSNHNLNIPPANGSVGELVVPSGGFLILASNASTFGSFYNVSESIIDTVMAMNNTEESISIIDDNDSSVDSVSFSSSMGANGDGKTLQLVSNSWVSADPTPGEGNSSSGASGGDDNDDIVDSGDSDEGGSTDEASSLEEFSALPYNTEILVPDIIMTGDEIELRAYTTNQEGMVTHAGTFMWNLGDGNFFNIKGTDKIYHTFEYPGTYKINLTYYKRSQRVTVDATDSITVKVISPTLEIESISKDGAIVVRNASSNALQIDGWSIVSDGFTFFFPQGSTIMANSVITLSPKTTKFPYTPIRLEIRSPEGVVAYKYPQVLTPTFSAKTVSYSGSSTLKEKTQEEDTTSTVPLVANSVSSGELSRDRALLILGIIFVLFGAGFYFYERGEAFLNKIFKKSDISKNKNISPDGRDEDEYFNPDDFTILEEDPK